MKQPLISVVIPFRNASPWIGEAMHSLLAQTESNFEIIAVDDGSTDNGSDIALRTIGTKLPITILQNAPDKGIMTALNRGLRASSGRYIARMDADDICLPNRFARQIEFIQHAHVDICGSWFIEFGQGIPRTVRWPHTESALRAAMLFQNTICHPTVMARREVFDKYQYSTEFPLLSDYDLFARVLANFHMANIPEVLLRYRRHPAQVTQSKRDALEVVAKQIRLNALAAEGIDTSPLEKELHNMIRASESIRRPEHLSGIQSWLLKLVGLFNNDEAKQVIATQWVRACIRAAPLGATMLREFHKSPLRLLSGAGITTSIDLAALAALRLNYQSHTFAILRRFGLSA